MKKLSVLLFWIVVSLLGVGAYAMLAIHRQEPVNSGFLLIAAICSYALGFRFYSKWVAARVLALNDRRATPCEVHEDGKDFVRTNKWIVFGHHFAAISGPGPLVGPVLAAQFGYLPGTLWILIGVVLGGAVQDFVILFCSMRRDGKSLGQMVKEEINSPAGVIGLFAILAILVILLAVLSLVVVRALAESPWGVFTVGATIPIAMFMGGYLRHLRPGKVMEASVIGVVLLLLAVWGGKLVHADQAGWGSALTLTSSNLAWIIVFYGLAASVLPVWLLLAPRDYLSTFMKLGTIFALVAGCFLVLPQLKFPAISQFIDGSGPVVAGKLFPFCFITIACGAISGFHTLISSGVTPKIIARESHARAIGYGAMLLESLVAIMALIAACSLDPAVYLCMNISGPAAATAAKVTALGFPATVDHLQAIAASVGEPTLFGRTGGAATLAVGMAQIFAQVTHGRGVDIWYHFAIMFEALFILTTIDAGTRVGRYILQDALGHLWKPLADTKSFSANALASALVVAGWGYFLIQGVKDPLGGINSLWPLFGIANQLLAAIALCLATTVILKIHLTQRGGDSAPPHPGRPALALVTLIPLVWLLAVTLTAGWQKIFHVETRIGFLAQARAMEAKLPDLQKTLEAARATNDGAAIKVAEKALHDTRVVRFNNQLDAVVAGVFMIMVVAIVALSLREWILLLARKRLVQLRETDPVWLPDYALAEGKPLHLFSLLALSLALLRELSGQTAVDRTAQHLANCPRGSDGRVMVRLLESPATRARKTRQQAYVAAAEQRFNGPTRCC